MTRRYPGSAPEDTRLSGAVVAHPDPSAGSGTSRHFGGILTRHLISILQGQIGTGGGPLVEDVLRDCGERRTPAELCDPGTWSSYEQFRSLLEAVGEQLGSPDALAAAARDAWERWARPDMVSFFQVLGSPAALFASLAGWMADMSPLMVAASEEVSPGEWIIGFRLGEEFAPFPELCAFLAGLCSAVPSMFGAGRADITELACACEGEMWCRLGVRWSDQERPAARLAGTGSTGLIRGDFRRQATTARVLLDLSTSLADVITPEEIAGRLARAAFGVIDCDRAFMVLVDPATSTARICGSFGCPAETDVSLRSIPIPVPPHGLGAPPGGASISTETDEFVERLMTETGAVASTAMPIRVHGELIGWLIAAVTERPERLMASGIAERLGAVGGQAAAAIANARLVEAIRHQSLHDELTGLPNRSLIVDRVEQMLSRARRQQIPAAVLLIGLDGFKDINDTLGHGAGDGLLRAVTARLATTLRESDTFGRLGGDEFVVLVEGVSLDPGAELVAERLLDVLRPPFYLDDVPGRPLSVTASVGIAIGDRLAAGELLRDAEVALYEAKAAGKDRCVLFESAMHQAVRDRHGLESDLRGALEADQFFLTYQPILALANRRVTGVEALLRWRHPTRGVVQPDNFIPLLEETGMIIAIGRWVLFTACAQTAAWRRLGHHLDIAVNVSARQLESDRFVDDVSDALEQSGLEPAALVIELTETTIMRDPAATARRLRLIRLLGVRVAIDDFGTGYSSLAYLSQFPVDALKIDRSFVSGSAYSPEAEALIRTLVQLAKSLNLETIAEGIEEEAQYRNLQALHCDSGQGFLFARPLEVDALEDFLASQPADAVPITFSELAPAVTPAAAHTQTDVDGERRLGADATERVLIALLEQHPEAPVAAVTRSNFRVEMPATVPLTRHKIIQAYSIAVDVVVATDQKAVSDAFRRATLQGTSRVSVHVANDPDRMVTLHYLDIRERHGVFLAILTGDHLSAGADAPSPAIEMAPLTPRFCRTRKDDHSVVLDIDAATSRIFGWTTEDMVGRRSLDFIHPDDRQRSINAWMEMAETPGAESRTRVRHQCRDGSWRWVELRNHNMLDDPIYPCVVGDMVDISEEVAALEVVRAREQLLDRIAEAMPVGLLQVDLDRNIISTNERLHEIVGSQPATTIASQMLNVIRDDRPLLSRALKEVLDEGRDNEVEVRLHIPDTSALRLCTLTLRALSSSDGTTSGAVICVADITDSRRTHAELERRSTEAESGADEVLAGQATFDLLTGCQNRASILRAAAIALSPPGGATCGTAVVSIDVSQFDVVAGELGPKAGDELLSIVASRLRDTVRTGDAVGRLGGHEFLIVCPRVNAAAETMGLGRRITAAFDPDVTIASTRIQVRLSIGVAWTEAGEADADALVSDAGRARDESQRRGGAQPVLFGPDVAKPAGFPAG